MTEREYYVEIRSIAEEAIKAEREENADIQEWLHETIDGHQWVIYTARNLEVLSISSNSEAGVDEGLVDANAAIKEGGMARLYAQLAYCAIDADVQEALGALREMA